jgi:PIN domain nuclease of toxin-antitoxin system
VTYILDTCTFIWLCSAPQSLSPTARECIDDPSSALALSDASVLEITLKWSAGKLSLPAPPRMWVETQAQTWSLALLPISRDDMYRAGELPSHHRDPFDRLLVSATLNHGATIITPDDMIRKYPVPTCW